MGIDPDSPNASRRRLFRCALGAWGAALAIGSAAQQAVPVTPPAQQIAAEVSALLAARINPAGPGVAVLVARGDTLLFRGARGMASIELGVPLSTDHVFRIGSITKQFSAAALLQQVDAGKAGLNDALARFRPDFPGGQTITLAQLLNHTSGVKSYTGVPGYITGAARRDVGTAELVAGFQNLPVDFSPGTAWAYNNSGYVLAGAVIEALTQQPWPRAVETMLRPLNLAHTRAGDDSAVVPGMADGYRQDAEARTTRALSISMTQPHAAGALLSTVDDLWRWNRALHGGELLKPDSYRRMTTPEGAPATAAGYGYGLMTTRLRGQPVLEHGGGIPGFLSMLMWLPGQQLTVVVLRNADGPGLMPATLAREIAAIALGQPYREGESVLDAPERARLALTPAQQQALVGSYTHPAFSYTVFIDSEGVLRGRAPGQPALQLYAQTPRRLYVKEVAAQFDFDPADADAGPVKGMTLTQGAARLVMVRQGS